MGMGYGHPDKPEDYAPMVRVVNVPTVRIMDLPSHNVNLALDGPKQSWWRRKLRWLRRRRRLMTGAELFRACSQLDRPMPPLDV
jgi:hypothetical protein